jgi:hypothetical protein
VGADEERTPLGLTALDTGGVFNPRCPDQPISTARRSISRSRSRGRDPGVKLNTRAYYYWTKLDNKSDHIEFGNAPVTPLPGASAAATDRGRRSDHVSGNCETSSSNYTKNNVGFDAWWKFAQGQRLGFGYDYFHVDMTRVDYDSRTRTRFWVEYKNTMFDTWSGRLKYQYLKARLRSQLHQQSAARRRREQPGLPAAVHVRVRPAEQHDEPVEADSRLEPDDERRRVVRGNWAKIEYDDVTFGRTESERRATS